MGNINSIEDQAWAESSKIKQSIARKCDCYVASVEHTNSIVDVKLNGLCKEISQLISPLRSMQSVTDLGLLGMSAILEDVEQFANTHKHVIKRLLTTLFNAQSLFEAVIKRHLDGECSASDNDDSYLDECCMVEMRAVIENMIFSCTAELEELNVSLPVKHRRRDELNRLLFKLAESTLSEGVDDVVTEIKDNALDDIDNVLCLAMMAGEFKDPNRVKETLHNIVTKAGVYCASLEDLPFTRRLEIEAAQEELKEHVEQLVRRIQFNHVHSPEDLKVVMNLDELKNSSSSDDSSEAGDSDEESEEIEEHQVVVSTRRATKAGSARSKISKEPAPLKQEKKRAASNRKRKALDETPTASSSKSRRQKAHPIEPVESSPAVVEKPARTTRRRNTRSTATRA